MCNGEGGEGLAREVLVRWGFCGGGALVVFWFDEKSLVDSDISHVFGFKLYLYLLTLSHK